MWVEFVTVELLPAVEEPSCLYHIICNLLQNLDQVQCLTAGREEGGGVDGHLHKQALYDIPFSPTVTMETHYQQNLLIVWDQTSTGHVP